MKEELIFAHIMSSIRKVGVQELDSADNTLDDPLTLICDVLTFKIRHLSGVT